ncbi:pyridoxal phosphate-dependent transferase [Lentinula aciculospora]|uniref:Kynureninase n=1 Tax=Lentinula aciculospora TaxID=153920 RepID=A0A9W9AT07_9AGAR|nr:pyridoxal phosphate-dependent transferase [Lentinula aciculospora]
MTLPPQLPLRSEFLLPTNNEVGANRLPNESDQPCTYLCGNSLGLMSKRSKELVEEEMSVWATRGVIGHFDHPHKRGWVGLADHARPYLAEIVGAKEHEVVCMSTLTTNLHLMMDSFYKPTPERYKILCEAKAFPSDQYAFASQAQLHGLDPAKAVLELSPRPGEFSLREEDILEVIQRDGHSIAVVIFSGVQYYTGQWFPMQFITQKAKEQGCICGWDLAHAVGNVPLSLHEWDVDFAVWCTYKYLNSGPGGIAGLYVHEKWNDSLKPKYAGWWGHDPLTRFAMPPKFSPINGAGGFQQSNPSILAIASLLGSLQTFKKAGMMVALRKRSIELTNHLERLLFQSKHFVHLKDMSTRDQGKPGFTIITPHDPKDRGAQLSLLFLPTGTGVMQKIFELLQSYGVIGDERQPDVIRLAPVHLYSNEADCEAAAKFLDIAFDELV